MCLLKKKRIDEQTKFEKLGMATVALFWPKFRGVNKDTQENS